MIGHLLIREDQHILFGFLTGAERRLFRSLLKVSGVGAKTALGILSGLSAEEFARAIESADLGVLTRLPGVGRKTAERLVVEMRDRVRATGLPAGPVDNTVLAAGASPRAEALDALIALGYKAPEARRLLEQVPEAVGSTEEILRTVLRRLAAARS